MAPRKKADPLKDFYFDKAEADRAARFFPTHLKHIIGRWAGQPFKLMAWQRDEVVRPLFGWKHRRTGKRRFRTCYLEIPRKNAKSTLAAGLAIKLLMADGEAAAEIYSAAVDKDQARIIFKIAARMVESDPVLESRCNVFRNVIEVPKTGNEYRALSSDAMTKHGFNAHGIIFDELHAQPNRELWDVLTTATGAREQPLVVACTTAGTDRLSICYEQHDYALKVASGAVVDPSYLGVVYAADADADPFKPPTWRAANPSLGETISLEYIRNKAAYARENPSFENTFRRLHLNQWTSAESAWVSVADWEACEGDFDVADLIGCECYAGLDLATKQDFTALVLLFPPTDDRPYYCCLCFFWLPADNLDLRSRQTGKPFDLWAKQGFIETTPGTVTDYAAVRSKIVELNALFPFKTLAYDEWNATQLATELDDLGVPLVEYRQGMKSLSPPTKELENWISQGPAIFQHGGNPVLDWMASNVVIRTDDAENRKPVKKKSKEKIDGIVALIMALGAKMIEEPPKPESKYNKTGLAGI